MYEHMNDKVVCADPATCGLHHFNTMSASSNWPHKLPRPGHANGVVAASSSRMLPMASLKTDNFSPQGLQHAGIRVFAGIRKESNHFDKHADMHENHYKNGTGDTGTPKQAISITVTLSRSSSGPKKLDRGSAKEKARETARETVRAMIVKKASFCAYGFQVAFSHKAVVLCMVL